MVVKVVSREVGKYSSGKGQSSYAFLCDAVAAYLHEGIFAPFVGHPAKQFVQGDGIGRGAFRWDGFGVNVIAYGAAQSAFVSHSAEYVEEHRGNCCLAVGPRHSYQFHPFCRVAVECRGEFAGHFLCAGVLQVCYVFLYVCRKFLAYHYRGTLAHSFVYIVVSVYLRASHGDENIAFLNLSGVYLDSRYICVGVSHYLAGSAYAR